MREPGGATTTTKNRYPGIKIREKLRSWKTTALASFQDELSEFIGLVEGEKNLRISDGKAAVRAVEIATAIPESYRTGRAIELTDPGTNDT